MENESPFDGVKIGDKYRCVERYAVPGYIFSVGDIITITSMTMSYCLTDIPQYKNTGSISIQWSPFENYFVSLHQYRNNIINELIK